MSILEKKLLMQNFQFLIFADFMPKNVFLGVFFGPKIRKNQKLKISKQQFFSKLLIPLTLQISRFYLQKQKSLRVFKFSEIQGFY